MEIRFSHTQSFTGYKSVFGKKLEKALTSPEITSQAADKLLEDFANMYDKKVCMNSKLGSGFYGSVYKIDDYYVLKKSNNLSKPKFSMIELVQKGKFKHLKHYFGEAVAKVYDNFGNDIVILKNVYTKGKTTPVGVPAEFSKRHTQEECLEYYYKNYLPKFAKLPQRSFDGIAKDFAELNKMCSSQKSYFFDFLNPNNFVLCGKTLRILDDINEVKKVGKNSVTDMLDVFVNKIDLDNDAKFIKNLTPLRKELTKKIILAGAKHKIPMCSNNADLSTCVKIFNEILGMEEINVEMITADIDKILLQHNKTKDRLNAVKKYLEEFVGL